MTQHLAPGLDVPAARRALQREFMQATSRPQRLVFLHAIMDFEDDIQRMRLPKKPSAGAFDRLRQAMLACGEAMARL